MHLFGGKFCRHVDDNHICTCAEILSNQCVCSRKNFDTLHWSLVTVFQVQTSSHLNHGSSHSGSWEPWNPQFTDKLYVKDGTGVHGTIGSQHWAVLCKRILEDAAESYFEFWAAGREFQTTALETAKSLAPSTVLVLRRTVVHVLADLKTCLLVAVETRVLSS